MSRNAPLRYRQRTAYLRLSSDTSRTPFTSCPTGRTLGPDSRKSEYHFSPRETQSLRIIVSTNLGFAYFIAQVAAAV